MQLIDILRLLDKLFNKEEFYLLCFSLDIDQENFGAKGKIGQLREFLLLLRRRQRLAELIDLISKQRPEGHPSWDSVYRAALSLQDSCQEERITSNQNLGDGASNWVGRQLGKYLILEKLGQRGRAEVYKGYRTDWDRFVAIKIMRPFWINQETAVHRFQQEAEVLAVLNHPHIVRLYEFESYSPEAYYLVMEYIHGPTLKEHLQAFAERGQRLALPEVMTISVQIADALAYAHQQGIIHRDIKPSNILLNIQGQAILTDFGIVKLLGGQPSVAFTATGEMLGTPAYMSPEQALGSQGDVRTDIYSLGVLLFYLTTGRLPFEADVPMAVVLKHLNEPVPLPQQYDLAIPLRLQEVILRAMDKDPDGRYSTMLEMIEALHRVDLEGWTANPLKARPLVQTTPSQSNQPESQLWTASSPAPFQVPPPIPYFVGRADILAELKAKLTATNGPQIIGLVGFGGVGKTAVVVQVTHELRQAFPDGIIWAQLGATTAEAELTSIAASFDQAESLAKLPGLPNKAEFLRDLLAHKQLLIVIDQAIESEQIKWLIPNGPANRVLITTRNGKLLQNVGADILPLPAMSQKEGIQYLETVIGEKRVQTELGTARQIVKQTGGLPLALSIVAGSLNQAPDLTLTEYATLLQDEHSRLDYLADWEDAARDVSASFEVSFRALPVRLQQLFASLAIFDGPDFDSHAVAAILRWPAAQVKLGLGRLYFLSLLSSGLGERDDLFPIEADGHGRYRLNPLLKAYAQRKLGEDETALRQRAAQYYADLAQSHCLPEGYDRLDLDWQNILAALHWTFKNQDLPTLHKGTLALTHNHPGTMGFLDARAHWSEARQLLQKAITSVEQLDPLDQAQLLTAQAYFTWRQGDSEAAQISIQQCWNFLTTLPNSSRQQLLQATVCILMFQLQMHRDRELALEWLKRSETVLAAIQDDSMSEEKGKFYISLSGMWGQMGQLVLAKHAAEQGLTFLPATPSSAQLTGLMNLGIVSELEGDFSQSLTFYERGLTLAKKLRHPRLYVHLSINLGIVLRRQGKYASMVDKLTEAIPVATLIGMPDLQFDLHNMLGRAYTGLGDDNQAQHHLRFALELAKEKDLPALELIANLNLAALYLLQKRPEPSQPILERAQEIAKALQNEREWPELYRLQAQLSIVQSDFIVAQQFVSKALDSTQKIQDRFEEGVCQRIQAKIWLAQRQLGQAVIACQASLSLLEGYDPYEIAQTQLLLAQIYLETFSQQEETRQLLQAAYSTFIRCQTRREIEVAQSLWQTHFGGSL